MRKRKRLYLCRHVCGDEYELGTSKRDFVPESGYFHEDLAGFCADEWERVTGVRLEPGEIRRINIEVQVLD